LRPPALLARRAAAPQPWLRRRAGSRMQSRLQCCRFCSPPHRWWTSPPPSLRYASPPDWTHTRSVARRGCRASCEHAESFPSGLRLQEPLTSIPSLARVLATPTPCGRTACTSPRLRCHCLARPHGVCALLGSLSLAQCLPPPSQVATPDQIAAAEKEGEARLKSCTTDECRSVITALNTKKMAKLTGA
jgi:hypothetical protein